MTKKNNDYLKGFGTMFVCHKTDNISKCEQFISGLMHKCKSNIERIAERVVGSKYDHKQAFVLDMVEKLDVYLTPPQLYIPAKKDGRGRTPTAFMRDSKPILLKDIKKEKMILIDILKCQSRTN